MNQTVQFNNSDEETSAYKFAGTPHSDNEANLQQSIRINLVYSAGVVLFAHSKWRDINVNVL